MIDWEKAQHCFNVAVEGVMSLEKKCEALRTELASTRAELAKLTTLVREEHRQINMLGEGIPMSAEVWDAIEEFLKEAAPVSDEVRKSIEDALGPEKGLE